MSSGSSRGKSTKTTKRKPTGKKNIKKNQNPGVAEEILLFGALGVAVLLFLGCCGLLGDFGKIVRGVLIGLFGMIAFVFPFAFFFVCAFTISNKWEKVSRVKIISTFSLVWILSCFAQMMFAKDAVIGKLTDYYTSKWKNGGFLGGIATHFLCKYLGEAGTVITLIVLTIICFVLITDRSLFTSIKEGTKIISEDAKRNAKYHKELNEVRSIEREERDLERWEKRNKKHEEHVERLEERRKEKLEERRRRAEERHENNVARMSFEASDLKKSEAALNNNNSEAEQKVTGNTTAIINQIDEVLVSDTDSFVYPGQSVVSKEEIEALAEPEALFYKNASSLVSSVKSPEDVSIEKEPSEEKSDGLMARARLKRPSYNGEMQEITGTYLDENLEESDLFPDAEPEYDEINFSKDVVNVKTKHKININSDIDEESVEEEFVVPSYDEEQNEDYDDVEEIFDKGKVRNITPKSLPKASAVNTADLKEENAKPTPESRVIARGISEKPKKSLKYKLPPTSLLNEVKNEGAKNAAIELNETARELRETLKTFGLDVTILGSSRGPAVTRFEIGMPSGVSVKKITGLTDDLMMSLGAKDIRIEAPIPGKKAVGIEIPNKESTMVHFKELIESKIFKNFNSDVAFAVGKDLAGEIIVTNVAKMPHLLIAGATGSGKSVCINTLIMSILYKATPDEVKMIMVDPKMVELSVYNDIPHLLLPVVTDPKKANAALSWAVNEMTKRYEQFASAGVRNIEGYNQKIDNDYNFAATVGNTHMYQLVIIVDELADLMMVAAKEVEESIARLAQLARAAGIYLVIATQRPSAEVVTGLIKANIPSRIAFAVNSGTDSRIILDQMGAERLLGYGDMLFLPRDYNKPARVQGAFVSDDEVERVVEYIKSQSGGASYDEVAISQMEAKAGAASSAAGSAGLVDPENAYDDLFVVAGQTVIESQKASIGLLQRKFRIGFNRAARIMDQLCDEGVVGAEEGTKPRQILMSMEEFNSLLEEKNHR